MKILEPGFYVVEFIDLSIMRYPFVAKYTGQEWYVPGIDYTLTTEDFIILSDRLQPPTKES